MCDSDVALAELHVRRAALYKTLCSFATTDADDGLEEAMNDTKQVRTCNDCTPQTTVVIETITGAAPVDCRVTQLCLL